MQSNGKTSTTDFTSKLMLVLNASMKPGMNMNLGVAILLADTRVNATSVDMGFHFMHMNAMNTAAFTVCAKYAISTDNNTVIGLNAGSTMNGQGGASAVADGDDSDGSLDC